MAVLSEQQVSRAASLLQKVEAEEPVLCSWRVEVGTTSKASARDSFNWAARALKSACQMPRDLPRPAADQIVVLTTALTPSTIGTLRPVLQELARRGRPAFVVTHPRTRAILAENLHRGHADIFELAALAGPLKRMRDWGRARELARELSGPLPESLVAGSERWIEFGMAVREGVRRWLRGAACVVADSDTESWRKGFFLGAQATGVPGYVLQHGLFGGHQFPLHAGNLLCWGEYFRRQATAYGLSPERARVTGSPGWDALVAEASRPRDPALRARLSPSQQPVILLLSTAHMAPTYPEHFAPYFESVRRLVEAGLQVALRLHPAERDTSVYEQHLPPNVLSRIQIVPPEISLYEALRHSDAVHHVFSAASLQAMVLSVPVLFERGNSGTVKLGDFPDRGGGAWSTPDTVVELASGAAGDGAFRRELLSSQEAFLDEALAFRGRATTEVTDLIESLQPAAVSPRLELVESK